MQQRLLANKNIIEYIYYYILLYIHVYIYIITLAKSSSIIFISVK